MVFSEFPLVEIFGTDIIGTIRAPRGPEKVPLALDHLDSDPRAPVFKFMFPFQPFPSIIAHDSPRVLKVWLTPKI